MGGKDSPPLPQRATWLRSQKGLERRAEPGQGEVQRPSPEPTVSSRKVRPGQGKAAPPEAQPLLSRPLDTRQSLLGLQLLSELSSLSQGHPPPLLLPPRMTIRLTPGSSIPFRLPPCPHMWLGFSPGCLRSCPHHLPSLQICRRDGPWTTDATCQHTSPCPRSDLRASCQAVHWLVPLLTTLGQHSGKCVWLS